MCELRHKALGGPTLGPHSHILLNDVGVQGIFRCEILAKRDFFGIDL